MGRLKTPVEVRRMNGNPGHRPMPKVSMIGTHTPLGKPPATIAGNREATLLWTRFGKEMPWLNQTNRMAVEMAVHAAVRYHNLIDYTEKRKQECKRNKQHPAVAELADNGKRDPIMIAFKDARDFYKSIIAELGGSPVIQARILEYLDNNMSAIARAKQREDELETYLT